MRLSIIQIIFLIQSVQVFIEFHVSAIRRVPQGAPTGGNSSNVVELCRVVGTGKGDHPLSVRLLPGNRRAMYLTADVEAGTADVEAETEIQCLGETPGSCRHSPDHCVPCPCRIDPLSPADSYVQLMMQSIRPRCRAAQEGQGIRVLLIGLGGGAVPQQILSHCPVGSVTVHVVDIDERVIRMARQYFGLPESRHLEVEHADATSSLEQRFGKGDSVRTNSVFLEGTMRDTELYDVALVDCMAGSGLVPLPCRSAHFVELLHKALRKGGLVMQNIWHYAPTAPEEAASEFSQTQSEYMRVFGNVDAVRPENPPGFDWQDLLTAVVQ